MKVRGDDKPDFVLVHGMGDDKSGFYKPLDFLSRRPLILPDCRVTVKMKEKKDLITP
jgi:hypothetical protein